MRIGLSTNFVEPALCHGKLDGLGTFTQELRKQLINHGEEVISVVFPPFKNLKVQCQLPQAHVLNTPYSVSAGLASLKLSMPGIAKLAKQIDLYHCTDYLVPRIKNIPVIASMHDAVKIQYPEWNGGRFRALKTIGLKKAAQWADHYITGAHAVIPELVQHFGIDPDKITVVHNAIADDWFKAVSLETKQSVLEKYQLKPGFLLFTGTFQPRKNIARILQAFNSLPLEVQHEHPLVLVGQRGWIEESVIDQIKILNAKGNVHWLNYISTPELRCLYQSASIFLLPSLHEGFGLPILEAFASSTPVITSNIFAMPEVAGDAAWLVDPYDIESIREGMLSLLSDSTKRDRFIALGSERVKQFTWDNCRKNTLAVYKKVLGVKC